MPRPILDESQIHPAIREKVATQRMQLVEEVRRAIAEHRVVVVGMGINPAPRRACRALEAAGIPFRYLEYGSYFSGWRPRTSLKMWTGWHTFPMVFVDGILVGGADDTERLLQAGELQAWLQEPRAP